MTQDLIGIIEAAYLHAPSRSEWQSRLLEACTVMDEGYGVILSSAKLSASGFEYEGASGTAGSQFLEAFSHTRMIRDTIATAASASGQLPATVVRAFGQAGGKTGSMIMGVEALGKFYGPYMAPYGVKDCIGINGLVGQFYNFGLYIPLGKVRTFARRTVRRLSLVGVHLAAAYRNWMTTSPEEAWITPSGKVVDASEGASKDRHALSLRVKAIESARSRKGRGEIDTALGMWKGLVAGAWSLVEHFESDGRRYLVAKRNPPDLGSHLRLSSGEERVLKLSALGHSQKYVAYTLGLSQPMVSAHLASAMLKLRIKSRAELMTMCGALFGG